MPDTYSLQFISGMQLLISYPFPIQTNIKYRYILNDDNISLNIRKIIDNNAKNSEVWTV